MHQRPGLVVVRERETDAKLHRRHRQPALHVRIRFVPLVDLGPALRELRLGQHLRPEILDAVVADVLVVVRAVGLARAVIKVALAHDLRRQAELARDAVDDLLDDDHALRPAETAERRVRRYVGLSHPAAEIHRRDVVGVVEVEQRAVVDRRGQVQRPAAVRHQRHLRGEQAAVAVITNRKAGMKRMPFAGQLHVEVAVELHAHRPARLDRRQRHQRRPTVALRFLAAEAAAHARSLHDDLVPRDVQHLGDNSLDLRRMLR